MSYYKSILHVMREMADGAIQDSNAPSIFDADDFSRDLTSNTVAQSTSSTTVSTGSTSTGSTNNGSSSVYDSGFVTSSEFNNHLQDTSAHQAEFAAVIAQIGSDASSIYDLQTNFGTLSGTLDGTILDLAGLSGTIKYDYLMAPNLIEGANIEITSSVDGSGRPTRTVNLDIERGIINGSINGILAGPFNTGVNYQTGRIVNGTLSNLSDSNAALLIDSVTSNGSQIQFYVKSGYSGTTVNSNFEIHWTMI